MLQKLNITPYAIILFFFGLTLIPVSLVSANERAAFAECEQMPTEPNNYKSLKRQKNCFRDVAKRLGAKKTARREFRRCQKIKPNRVSTRKMQQKIDCFMDVASSLMPDMAPPAGPPGMPPTMAPQQEVEQQAAQADDEAARQAEAEAARQVRLENELERIELEKQQNAERLRQQQEQQARADRDRAERRERDERMNSSCTESKNAFDPDCMTWRQSNPRCAGGACAADVPDPQGVCKPKFRKDLYPARWHQHLVDWLPKCEQVNATNCSTSHGGRCEWAAEDYFLHEDHMCYRTNRYGVCVGGTSITGPVFDCLSHSRSDESAQGCWSAGQPDHPVCYNYPTNLTCGPDDGTAGRRAPGPRRVETPPAHGLF